MVLLSRASSWVVVAAVASCSTVPSGFGKATPATLTEAIAELRRSLRPEDLEEMRSAPEEAMAGYHLDLGMWIRNNWGLWSDGPLARHFNGLGIEHPDDMSGIILTSLWRDLNERPLRIEEQVAFYREYWRQNTPPERAVCPVHGSELDYLGYSTEESSVSSKPDTCFHEFRCSTHTESWHWQVDRGFFTVDQAKGR